MNNEQVRAAALESIADNPDAMIILTQGYKHESVISVVDAHTKRQVDAAIRALATSAAPERSGESADDKITLPIELVASACYVIRKTGVHDSLLEKLRAYTTGEFAKVFTAKGPLDECMSDNGPIACNRVRCQLGKECVAPTPSGFPAAPSDEQIAKEAEKYSVFAGGGQYDITRYECEEDFFNCVRACAALAAPAQTVDSSAPSAEEYETLAVKYRQLEVRLSNLAPTGESLPVRGVPDYKIYATIAKMGWDLDDKEKDDMYSLCKAILEVAAPTGASK